MNDSYDDDWGSVGVPPPDPLLTQTLTLPGMPLASPIPLFGRMAMLRDNQEPEQVSKHVIERRRARLLTLEANIIILANTIADIDTYIQHGKTAQLKQGVVLGLIEGRILDYRTELMDRKQAMANEATMLRGS